MQSFKAANAGACFQDFVTWYQIEPFDVQCLRNSTTSSNNISTLDAATEAAQVLTATRKMWMGCWERSKAVPADCQQPLFDGSQEIEKILHYFETMHPSNLINQVFTVSLTNTYFILRSIGELRMDIKCVNRSFERLEELILKAIHDLNECLIQSSKFEVYQLPPEVIAICEDVCDCISAIETMLSYIQSLSNNFPGIGHDIIEIILMNPDKVIVVEDVQERKAFLRALKKLNESTPYIIPDATFHGDYRPVERDFIFRTLRGKIPSRMYVNVKEDFESKMDESETKKCVLMAFAKSFMD